MFSAHNNFVTQPVTAALWCTHWNLLIQRVLSLGFSLFDAFIFVFLDELRG